MINEYSNITSKSDRQDLGVSRFITASGVGILEYVPRFGKTNTALKCASEILKTSEIKSILYIVTNDVQQKQVYSAINKYNHTCLYEDRINDIYVTTSMKYSENHMNTVKEYALIIYDEVHKWTTQLKYEALKSTFVTSKHKLGLTGTMPVGEERYMLTSILPIVDVITEDEAISNKWISDFVEFNYSLDFTASEKNAYVIYTEHITHTLTLFKGLAARVNQMTYTATFDDVLQYLNLNFNSDFDLIMACGKGMYHKELGRYINASYIAKCVAVVKGYNRNLDISNDYNKMIVDNWNPDTLVDNCNKFKTYIDNRNSIMTDSSVKKNAIVEILQRFNDEVTIIFMGSTKSADELTELLLRNNIPTACYHSKVKSRYLRDNTGKHITYKNGKPKKFGKTGLLKYAIEGIKSKNVRVLVTVNSLDEGLDIPTASLSIAAFGSTNPIQHIQRSARVKTIDITQQHKKVKVLNLYFNDFVFDDRTIVSRDKTKLLLRQKKNTTHSIQINDLENLIFS